MDTFQSNRLEARPLGRDPSDRPHIDVDAIVEGDINGLPNPEFALRWSVLLNAVESYRQTGYATHGLIRIRHEQDKRWFNSNDRTWPFSFLNLCDARGLDPRSVKKRLWGHAPG
ncbi:MAG: hypothetical protein ACREQQ_14445 [Candidatus Binatia bacterium]